MVAINFMKQFAPLILDGSKIHTLRDKARCKPGDALQLYYGQRTRQCQLLKKVVCTAVVQAQMLSDCHWLIGDTEIVSDIPLHRFAVADGFSSYQKMFDWFVDHKGPQWSGFLIAWGEAPYLPRLP